MGDSLTVKQTAEKMGRSIRLVNKFIAEGRLKAERFGRAWMVRPQDLAAFMAIDRPPGYHGHRARRPAGKKKGK